MSDLEFSKREEVDNPKRAVGMYSKEREYVSFLAHCCCVGPVSIIFVLFSFFFLILTNPILTNITDCVMTLR